MLKLLRLLFLLLPASVAIAQSTGEVAFDRQFGEPGSPAASTRTSRVSAAVSGAAAHGPLQVRRGGAQLAAHGRRLHAARVRAQRRRPWLALVGTPAETHFERDLATSEWTYEKRDDGVAFSIDSGKGLVLEKNLRHDPTQRGFVLELVLRNTGAEPVGQVVFTLLGPALVNPPEVSLLGSSSVAIADTGDGAPKHVGPLAGKVQPLDVDLKNLSFAGNTNRFFGPSSIRSTT
jgi:hypothetical protein